MAKKFAVFDIDGTIARTSLFFQIVDELIAAGHLPAELRAELDDKLETYRRRSHDDAFSEYAQASVNILFDNLVSVKLSDYRRAVDKVVERTSSYVYVYTRELVKSLKQQGYFLIALSGSETYAIEKFTAEYDFDAVLGDVYETAGDTFTGEVQSVIFDKGTALKKVVAEHKLDYAGSVAIGDSRSDSKMLELVEQPIAFNPERQLFELAKQRGWKIVIERKNMIYKLEPNDGSYVLAQAD